MLNILATFSPFINGDGRTEVNSNTIILTRTMMEVVRVLGNSKIETISTTFMGNLRILRKSRDFLDLIDFINTESTGC